MAKTTRINITINKALLAQVRAVKKQKGISVSQQLARGWKKGNATGLWGWPRK